MNADNFHVNSEFTSGYIQINDQLTIADVSGQITSILRIDKIEAGESFLTKVESLKNNTRSFFREEIIPAIQTRRTRNFTLDRKETILKITITALDSGSTILSFEECPIFTEIVQEKLSEKLNEVFIRISPDLIVSHISKNCSNHLGIRHEEAKGRHIETTGLFGEQTYSFLQMINKVFQAQKRIEDEIKFIKNGKTRWLKASLIPEADPVNGQQSVFVILENIKKYRQTEQKLETRKQHLLRTIEATDLGFWECRIDKQETFYSRKWKAMLGYYPDESIDTFDSWRDYIHPEDKDRVEHYNNKFLESDSLIYEAEFRMKHKNGNYIWVESKAIAIRDEHGEATRLYGTHRDITKQKKSQAEYEKLHQAIMQSPSSLVITDLDGYIEFFNPAFCKFSGWTDKELFGKKTNILKSGYHDQTFYEEIWKTIQQGKEWQGEIKNRKKNGDLYWELASISPIKNRFGSIANYVKISEDISYMKEIEDELIKAKKEADIANSYKNQFLANMSHEIRTPLNTIIGFSELMKNPELTSEKRYKYSEVVEENSQALLRLIDDIIDISKIEANELVIKKEACSLVELFAELKIVYGNYLRRKRKRNIELVFQVPEDAHLDVIHTDPYRLKQILNNLFLNALNHTDQGQIEVGYNILEDKTLRFFISDTGTGIPANRIKHIFNRFNAPDETKSHIDTPGLGLSICKDLAVILGGDVTVKSIPNEGSTFFLIIPNDQINRPLVKPISPSKSPVKYNFSNFNIMVADDSTNNYEYISSILQKTGATIIWAKDGIDVLTIYSEMKIDLILMEIELAEINGYDVTAQIRKIDQKIPIIVLSGFAMAGEKQKCYDLGCSEVLLKPVRGNDVLIAISKYLKK